MSAFKTSDLPGDGKWKELFLEAERRGKEIVGDEFDADTIAFVGLFGMLAELKAEVAALSNFMPTPKPKRPAKNARLVSGPLGPVSLTTDELRANLRQALFKDVYLAEIAAFGSFSFGDGEKGNLESESRSRLATNAAVRAVKAFDEHA